MTCFLLGVDAQELQLLSDALASIPDELAAIHSADVISGLHDRLDTANELNSQWAEQFLRHIGVGRTRGRPQG